MTLPIATAELVEQQVRDVLEQRADAEAIALRAEPRWAGGPCRVDGRRVVVAGCLSPLAVRAALTDWTSRRPRRDEDLLVVLCDLADAELGADVLARFTPARVLGLEPWKAAAALFGVRHLDAAFRKDDGWIADALLAHVPAELARPMTAGGVLTVEVALDALARVLLGADQLTVDAVLDAAARPAAFAGFDGAEPAARSGMLGALRHRHGALGALVAAVLESGQGADLLAIGLAARAVYGVGDHDGGKAAGHLEARCANVAISPAVGAALARRSEEVVAGLFSAERDRANVVLAEGADLATRISADHVEASDWLPAGFDRRISVAAGLIGTVLDALAAPAGAPAAGAGGGVAAAISGLDDAVGRVGAHRYSSAPAGATRHDHLEMAARLTAWLATPPVGAEGMASFEDAAARYADSSAWVDRARRRLWHGDADPGVGATYRRVLDAVVARRGGENQRFAERLASWTVPPSAPSTRPRPGVVAVEDVAAEVLAPLAAKAPLLFVVLDGCGLASFAEIAPQLSEAGYREVARTGAGSGGVGRRLTGVAALPTVTEVSRASLVAGRLDRGDQDHERRAFAGNAVLRVGGRAAAFFHQNRLLGPAGSSLAAEVDAALGPGGPPVVGVVINTIDDQLKRGTFADELRLVDLHALVSLLEAARTHGRTVVISADHGHVLAQPDAGGAGAFQGGGTGGERWRVADRPPGPNEVVLRGERVRLGGEGGVLAPWDDDFRYGAKAGGYHGGATPEEVLVPVAVFTPAGIPAPSGWEHAAQVPPLWWDLRLDGSVDGSVGADGAAGGTTAPVRGGSRRRPPAKPVDEAQVPMFDLPPVVAGPPPVPEVTPAAAGGTGAPAWIDALLASDVWKLQKGAAGRAPLPEDRVRSVLAAVARRGTVTSFAALATDAGVPMARLGGFLVHLARVLNVDGYAVLDVDAGAGEVRLSLPVLAQQFEIPVAPT